MIKVTFKEATECFLNSGKNLIIAKFILCETISKLNFGKQWLPSLCGTHLYIPTNGEYIQSIEHVKPTDL